MPIREKGSRRIKVIKPTARGKNKGKDIQSKVQPGESLAESKTAAEGGAAAGRAEVSDGSHVNMGDVHTLLRRKAASKKAANPHRENDFSGDDDEFVNQILAEEMFESAEEEEVGAEDDDVLSTAEKVAAGSIEVSDGLREKMRDGSIASALRNAANAKLIGDSGEEATPHHKPSSNLTLAVSSLSPVRTTGSGSDEEEEDLGRDGTASLWDNDDFDGLEGGSPYPQEGNAGAAAAAAPGEMFEEESEHRHSVIAYDDGYGARGVTETFHSSHRLRQTIGARGRSVGEELDFSDEEDYGSGGGGGGGGGGGYKESKLAVDESSSGGSFLADISQTLHESDDGFIPIDGNFLELSEQDSFLATSLYMYKDETHANKENLKKAETVHKIFFRAIPRYRLRANGEAKKLFNAIVGEVRDRAGGPIDLSGYTGRSVVLACGRFLSRSGVFPPVVFQLGNTFLDVTQFGPTPSCMGNVELVVKVPNHKEKLVRLRFLEGQKPSGKKSSDVTLAYGSDAMHVFQEYFLGQPSEPDYHNRVRKLVELFKSHTKLFSAFSSDDFNGLGRIKSGTKASEGPMTGSQKVIAAWCAHCLTGFHFLVMIVEVARRLFRGDFLDVRSKKGKACDRLPFGLFATRMLNWLENGKVNFQDFFGESDSYRKYKPKGRGNPKESDKRKKHRSWFNPSSGTNTASDYFAETNTKAERLFKGHGQFFHEGVCAEGGVEEGSLASTDIKGHVRHGCKGLKHELVEFYGQGDETDDEFDYSDEEDCEERITQWSS